MAEADGPGSTSSGGKSGKGDRAAGKTARQADSRECYASVYPGREKPLPEGFVKAVRELEQALQERVWICIQASGAEDEPYSRIDNRLVKAAQQSAKQLSGQRACLLLHSPGGYAKAAYQVAMAFRRSCKGFTAVVPSYAKSAATLLALGADRIFLGENAELGPLDVQVFDADRDAVRSALDEVQALERLHAFALEAADSTMFVLATRTGKSVEKLLPLALGFCTDMMRPLLEKIDTVHFTQASRQLKEAEEYAVRLLEPFYKDRARGIASALVERYPEHGFPIDAEELSRLGIKLARTSREIKGAVASVEDAIEARMAAIGYICSGDEQ